MLKPNMFLGSSTEQSFLLDLITVELGDSANVEPWVTSFEPGHYTLQDLVSHAIEADFALFVLAPDDRTEFRSQTQASPRDNVVFEAGLFAGVIGIERTFLLHAKGTKVPSDLDGLTRLEYDPKASLQHEIHRECAKVRQVLVKHKPRKALLPGRNSWEHGGSSL